MAWNTRTRACVAEGTIFRRCLSTRMSSIAWIQEEKERKKRRGEKKEKKRKHREAIARSFQEVHRPRRDLPGCEREQKIIKRGNTDSASKEESQRRGKRRNRE